MYETLLVERRGRVAIITINRPEKRNALNIQTRMEGAAALDELREDDSVGVVVFTGAGDKAFIAGADIAEFAGRTALTQREVMLGRSLFTAIDGFPKPVIAMINGYCLGGGCELALPSALRMAKEAVKLASRSNLDEGLRREVDLFALCFSSEDKDEGVKAFLEKRKPVFKGK